MGKTVITRVTDTIIQIRDEANKIKFKLMLRVLLAQRGADGTVYTDNLTIREGVSPIGNQYDKGMLSRTLSFEMRIVFDSGSFNTGTRIDIGDLNGLARMLNKIDEMLESNVPGEHLKRSITLQEFISLYNNFPLSDRARLDEIYGVQRSQEDEILNHYSYSDICIAKDPEFKDNFFRGPIWMMSNYVNLASVVGTKRVSTTLKPDKGGSINIVRELPCVTITPFKDGSSETNNLITYYLKSFPTDNGLILDIYEWRRLAAFCTRFDPYIYTENIINTFIYSMNSPIRRYMSDNCLKSTFETEEEIQARRYRDSQSERKNPDRNEYAVNDYRQSTTPTKEYQRNASIYNELSRP